LTLLKLSKIIAEYKNQKVGNPLSAGKPTFLVVKNVLAWVLRYLVGGAPNINFACFGLLIISE
jgi:hypothetical protein